MSSLPAEARLPVRDLKPDRAVPARRGKPSPAQSAAITRAIIDAATEMFLKDGYEGTAMEAVAATVGIPKRTLYKRFPDKVGLLNAVLVERVAAWSTVTSHQNPKLTDDLGQRLRQYVTTMLVWSATAEVRAFTKLFASAHGLSGRYQGPQAFHGRRKMDAMIASDITQYGPAQGFHTQQPVQIANVLMALVAGWLELKGNEAPVTREEAAKQADLLVGIVLHGKDAW